MDNLNLPPLSPDFCWRVHVMYYGGTYRWALELFDYLNAEAILSHGWRTGYTPAPEQIEGRAKRLMSDFVILGGKRPGKPVQIVAFTQGVDPEAPIPLPQRYRGENRRAWRYPYGPRSHW